MPKTSFQNSAIKEQRSREILEVALRLFAKKGFEKVSIDMIADECKISHGLFYHYFQSKNEILESLNAAYLKDLEEGLLKIYREGEEGEIYLRKCLNFVLNTINSNELSAYYSHLFYETLLGKLNSNQDYTPFSKKLDDLIYKSIRIIRKESTNITNKEFDSLLIYLLLLLNAYTLALINYPRLVREEPKAETIINFISHGIKGGAHFEDK